MAKNQSMSKIIKLLIISDLLIYFGIGLTSNILSIFIKDNLGGTILIAGFAMGLFLLIKSVLQIVFSKIFSRKHRLKMVLIGSALIAITPFIYAFSNNLRMLLLAQAVYGLGAGLTAPAWMNMFVKNLSQKRPGFEWSVYSTIVNLGIAIAAYLGAWLVQLWGFKSVFILSGIFGILGTLVLLKLTEEKMK